MLETNGIMLCDGCFEEIHKTPCRYCGYDPDKSTSDNTLLPPGSCLSEKYIIGGIIGIGGFGVTYLAYNKLSNRKVAVKEYFPRGIARRNSDGITVNTVSKDDLAIFEAGAKKLYSETAIVSEFKDNPNIVTIYDLFRANNTVYLTMEFLHGKTLKEYIHNYGVLDSMKTAYIAQCVLNALSAVHGANVLHRDISPDNIILCGNGDVKLIDFGSARQIVAERTQNFSAIVKFGFAPPEQYRKNSTQGAWSDIYSLGATLYYALTGDIPADPMSRFENDDTFVKNSFGIDEEMWNVITKAVKLNSNERYQSTKEMSDALKQLSFVPEPIIFSDNNILDPKPKLYGRSYVPTAPSAESKRDVNKVFWTKRRRVAAAAGGIAVISAGVIISMAVNGSKPAVPTANPYNTISSVTTASETTASEETTSSVTAVSEVSVTIEPPVPLTETYPYFAEYRTKPYYTNMNEKERKIYEIVYNGLTERRKLIMLPEREYTYQEVNKYYFQVVYDNPWICDVGDYAKHYSDDNGNDMLDHDEYIDMIEPDYLNVNYNANTFRNCIEEMLRGADRTDSIEALRYVHDKMIYNVSVVARYVTQSCTHAYGSIVHMKADDMGFAQGFCVYAQALGLPSRVIDGTKNGNLRAWCAVQIDGTWYNIDVYGDMFAHNNVSNIMRTDRDAIFHTYFLANDKHFKELGYVPDGGWESLGGEEFAADSPFDNYYVQYIQGLDEYFCTDAQDAYDSLLQKTAEAVESGIHNVSMCVSPVIAEELYSRMDEMFVSDCAEKYGISLSGYSVEYSPEAYSVKLVF